MTGSVAFSVNGRPVQVGGADLDLPLVDYLHDELDVTGTKFCCGIGVCRACTVAVRRTQEAPLEVLLACSTPVSQLDGMALHTVEGLADGDDLHPLQHAVLTHFAFQCGYCTPGFLMAAWVLLDRLRRSPIPARELDAAIERALGQHICRCSGYVRYYQAVRAVIRNEPGLLT